MKHGVTHKTPRSALIHGAILSALLISYLVISLRGLAVVPPVYEDEPWQASTGWKLATQGVFGSEVFTGLYGMERHYYAFMPVHPLLLAATFKLAGLGLVQARVEAVAMGLLTLLITYVLARRLFGPEVGLLAVAMLLCVRLTGTTRYQPMGILFLDRARVARYDSVVPVFGLLSLCAYLSAAGRDGVRMYVLAGMLAALAGLSHLYGAFWILALGLLVWLDGSGWRTVGALAIGFAGPWLIYLVYVAGGVADWQGQTREYGPRFQVFNPWWYWRNLVTEPTRYGPGLGPPGWGYLLRPGFWISLIALPAALFVLARRALAGDRAAAAIAVPTLVFVAGFALLIHEKRVYYTLTMLPLGMIAVAWLAVSVWRWAGDAPDRHWLRVATAGLLAAMAVEGASRVAVLEAEARTTTPYADFIARVRAQIPQGARVLGLHNYWFGLDDFTYVSWFVPIRRADPAYVQSAPTLEQALDDVAPDAILIDARMRAYFETAQPSDRRPSRIRTWMENRGFRRKAVIDDRSYGRMEIFVVPTDQ